MIVDTSAIVAILREEPEAGAFLEVLAGAERVSMSTGSWIELGTVLTRTATPALPEVCDTLFEKLMVHLPPVSVAQAEMARTAYAIYGRGSGHRARLNFGDCFAYALAKDAGEPLLFKGDDFIHTDVAPAIA